MNIVVSAGACRHSGAKTIYMQMIEHLKDWVGENNYTLFIDESMPRPDIRGVEYVTVDVKNNIDRILFDYKDCKQLLKGRGIKPDLVVSLQNTGVACLKDVWQVIYYHQPLPFYPQRWNPLLREERTMWMYKYVYPMFVKSSIRKDRVDFIAQIPFIKEGIVARLNMNPQRVHVLFPDTEKVNIKGLDDYKYIGKYNFVYPATNIKYKNHVQIVRALSALSRISEEVCKKINVYLTLEKSQNLELDKFIKETGLEKQIVMCGAVDHKQLMEMINSSHGLLFPSTIETLGLPLLEAARLGKAIVAADLTYAHQVVGGYEGVTFANAYDADSWAEKIIALCVDKPLKYSPMEDTKESSWNDFFRLVESRGGGNLRFNHYAAIYEERRVAA